MPRVTKHACIRYLIRRPGLLGQRLSLPRLERIASESVANSLFVTREEAAQRVGPIRNSRWNRYYRVDETGKGVWVSCWYRGEEVVITYLRARFRTLRTRRYVGRGVVVARLRRRMFPRFMVKVRGRRFAARAVVAASPA